MKRIALFITSSILILGCCASFGFWDIVAYLLDEGEDDYQCILWNNHLLTDQVFPENKDLGIPETSISTWDYKHILLNKSQYLDAIEYFKNDDHFKIEACSPDECIHDFDEPRLWCKRWHAGCLQVEIIKDLDTP